MNNNSDRTPPHRGASLRLIWIIISLIGGSLSGVLLSVLWGVNFKTHVLTIDGLGTFYRIALEDGIESLSDVRRAKIGAPDASDHERIGVNNSWIATSENIRLPLRLTTGDVQGKEEMEKEILKYRDFVVNRHHDGQLRPATISFVNGKNYIVYEMEMNEGYCLGHFQIQLNDMDVSGVPFDAPSDPSELFSLWRRPVEVRSEFPSLLCSRRIVEIDLGLKANPFERLRGLVGWAKQDSRSRAIP